MPSDARITGDGELVALVDMAASLNLPEVLSVAAATATALDLLHARQIIYGRLCPANIRFDQRSRQVALAELSPEADSNTAPDLAYLAPEQLGHWPADERSDLYALGLVLYELLAGAHPFQCDDPLLLVHAQLASVPTAPHELIGGRVPTPAQVSAIVMRLLAKDPVTRYQSAFGFRCDLERCLHHLAQGDEVPPFPLGEHDESIVLRLPNRLFGRGEELATLLAAVGIAPATDNGVDAEISPDAYDNVGTPLLALVTGPAGSGKSALLRHVCAALAEAGGWIVHGKCDQYRPDAPYLLLEQVLTAIANRVLAAQPADRARWGAALSAAADAQAAMLAEIAPALQRVIDTAPADPSGDLGGAIQRFDQAVLRLLAAAGQIAGPLTLVLDDLQWIDAASLRLFGRLLRDNAQPSLVILASYREGELEVGHQLRQLLDRVFVETSEGAARAPQAPHATLIRLGALRLDDVKALIASTFRRLPNAEDLARFVYRSSNGNPLAVTQLLTSLFHERLLSFDFSDHTWRWQEVASYARAGGTDVAALTLRRYRQLPPEYRELLELAACLGASFDLEILRWAGGRSMAREVGEPSVTTCLQPAIVAGLIALAGVPHSGPPWAPERSNGRSKAARPNYDGPGSYVFLHDQVQQAIYEQIDPSRRLQLHYQLGHTMLTRGTPEWIVEHLFMVVDQLNAGRGLLTDEEAKLQLAELNWQAGERALAGVAFGAAGAYFAAARSLLPSASWSSAYELTLAVFLGGARAALAGDDIALAKTLVAATLPHARTPLARAELFELSARANSDRYNMSAAAQDAWQALNALGVDLVEPPTEVARAADFARLPISHNPELRTALRLIEQLILTSDRFVSDVGQRLFWTGFALIRRYGTCAEAAPFYVMYGARLCGIQEPIDIAEGHRFGQLALDLVARLRAKITQVRVQMAYNSRIAPWVEPQHVSLGRQYEVIRQGIDQGIPFWARLAVFDCARRLIYSGLPLDEVQERFRSQADQLVFWHGYPTSAQLLENLRGEVADVRLLKGSFFDETDPASLDTSELPTWRQFYEGSTRMLLRYLFGEPVAAVELGATVRVAEESAGLTPHIARHYLYQTLALLADDSRTRNDPQALAHVEAFHTHLRRWAAHVPTDYQHLDDLVAAERARVAGQPWEAAALYDRAIGGAHEQGMPHDEALSCELATRHFLAHGISEPARAYLGRAYTAYGRWGAVAKQHDLKVRYGAWLDTGPAVALPNGAASAVGALSATETLDHESLLRAARTLVNELDLDATLVNVLTVAMQSVGARAAALLLPRDGHWMIEALADDTGNGARRTSLRLEDLGTSDEGLAVVPSIVWYVINTRARAIVDDTSSADQFAHDPLFRPHPPSSILCAPLLRHGQIVGVLYLVKARVTGAFLRERVELLELLGAQAAIAITHAQLVADLQSENVARRSAEQELQRHREHLEDLVAQRTAELQAANAELEESISRREEFAREAAVIEERNRIARDLHDSVTQTLFSASLIAEALPRIVQQSPERAGPGADELRQLTRGALAEMRTLLYELRPAAFSEKPLSELLGSLCNAFAGRMQCRITLQFDGPCTLQPGDVQTVFYRTVQEALNNVWKHAAATTVAVKAISRMDLVEIEVRDDGKGFDPEQFCNGAGAMGVLRERAASIGAELHIVSKPGKGTTVRLSWAPPSLVAT
ncbi:MAG: AAA family ATPase [Chloroflexales bacterium]|nr:AAA family ATPase [Chloroflexales bacterium]